jgi:hypothetical protein
VGVLLSPWVALLARCLLVYIVVPVVVALVFLWWRVYQ